jgi:Flp pilus assembly protein TadG
MTDGAATDRAVTAHPASASGPRIWRGDERGMAATVVLFPVFAAVVFMFVNAVFWQHGRQVAAEAADRASQSVALYGYSVGRAETVAVAQLTAAGLDEVSVSISRGAEATTVVVSGTADGLLPGMSVTVTARSITPSEGWQD